MGSRGQATRAEMKFVNAELTAPLDIEGLACQIPQGMEAQANMASLMTINWITATQHGFAHWLYLEKDQVKAIHDHAKAPRHYT